MRSCAPSTPIRKRSQNTIQHFIEPRAEVVGQETKDEIAVFLQSRIFATVSPVCVGIGQVLAAVELDHQALFLEEKIDFHRARAVKRDRQLCVQASAAGRFRHGLEPAVEKGLGRAASAIDTLRVVGESFWRRERRDGPEANRRRRE